MLILWLSISFFVLVTSSKLSSENDIFYESTSGISSLPKSPFITMFPSNVPEPDLTGEDVGDPLILTPLLEAGKIGEAQEKAQVQNLSNEIVSYTGFFTVNKKFNSNLFFWLVLAEYPSENTPLLVWLQGGPGGSSLFGFFIEHGPFAVEKDLNLKKRSSAWSTIYNVLYIDQPAGTGFSFTDNEKGYATDQNDVARDLYEAMRQFYIMFPKLRSSDLYVTGESYAGKYVPALSFKIHQENSAGKYPKMPLVGLAIGDGLSDPINQLDYGDFLFQTGLVDENDNDKMDELVKTAKQTIQKEDWHTASVLFGEIIDFFTNKTHLTFYYNYLISHQPEDFNYHVAFLQQPKVRKAIHVGNLTYNGVSMEVHDHLFNDMAKTVKPWIEELLNNDYKVMIYNGQLDVIVAYPLTENYISALDWRHAGAYANSTRLVWTVGNDVAGYVREVGHFCQVMVRNAGHILPYDQPKWAFDMIHRFVAGKSFS